MTRPYLMASILLFVVSCGLVPFVPLADDELYYWCWSQSLQLSYYDHPPMSAYMIRLATELTGNTLLGVRLPACLSTAVVFGIILYLTRPRAIAWCLLLTPLFTLGSVIVTPDTPLLMFWSIYIAWLVHIHKRLDEDRPISLGFWTLGGVILGCGVLGKYTMGLAVPAGFVAFLLAGNWQRWLAGYIYHGAISFLVASPILIHNIQHDFVPLKYQWEHSMGTIDPSLKRFGEFVGIQILLFGTLPVFLFPWVIVNARRLAADPRLRICLCMYGLPFAFFLYKASRGPLEGNWALVSYLAFWPLAADWYERVRHSRFWRVAGPASFVLPALAVIAVTLHLIQPIRMIRPMSDRITRQSEKYKLAEQIASRFHTRSESLPIFTDTYQWVALLRFHGLDARQIDGVTRPSHFTQKPETLADVDQALIFWTGIPPKEFIPGDARLTLDSTFPLLVRDEVICYFMIWRYTRERNPLETLGSKR